MAPTVRPAPLGFRPDVAAEAVARVLALWGGSARVDRVSAALYLAERLHLARTHESMLSDDLVDDVRGPRHDSTRRLLDGVDRQPSFDAVLELRRDPAGVGSVSLRPGWFRRPVEPRSAVGRSPRDDDDGPAPASAPRPPGGWASDEPPRLLWDRALASLREAADLASSPSEGTCAELLRHRCREASVEPLEPRPLDHYEVALALDLDDPGEVARHALRMRRLSAEVEGEDGRPDPVGAD